MKKSLLLALIFTFSWSLNFAHDGDTTCTENCQEVTTNIFIGEWSFTNMSYRVADATHSCGDLIIANDAFLNFNFEENGTYTKSFGTGSAETIETGTWTTNSEGSSLVLFPNGADTSSQMINIIKMGKEKVELKLDIDEAGLNGLFCEKINILKFSKNILPIKDSVIR